MAANKILADCKHCGEAYCYNCSSHEGFEDFCSLECAKEFKETTKERIKGYIKRRKQ
ncbi:MAG: hypothetical protein NUV76_02510 [Candidatus Kuenenia sp.]|nr:hypothetical protein [Candidatus Kuenenia sp.]